MAYVERVKEALRGFKDCKSILDTLIQIDILGNTLTGGDPGNTISGRVGYHVAVKPTNPFWAFLAFVIDMAFWPIDGLHHCERAWLMEKDHRRGNDVGLFFMGFFALIVCIPLILLQGVKILWDGLKTGLHQLRK